MFFSELGIKPDNVPTIFGDNKGVVQVANGTGSNPGFSKHVDIEEKPVQDAIARGEISVIHVAGSENVFDTFTKPLSTSILGACYIVTIRRQFSHREGNHCWIQGTVRIDLTKEPALVSQARVTCPESKYISATPVALGPRANNKYMDNTSTKN